ncbi:GFA family protein [Roseateles saccharophilus]|uniref:CENP-V/GFA domain-containing protein n=2 Tax=Roseateles saccharophilus TaxID=304 RepID=A0A4R3UJY6_ROSSA|nr:GFA family protein [Roseateles saccharophilus]TCU90937.1 hypothetical protein EV671_102815 [Roseateles saccharophilus]
MTRAAPTTFSIRCYCSAVSLQADAPPTSVVHCHCGQCRRLSGAAFTTWVSFPRAALATGSHEALSAFRATPNVRRHFCRICGCHVFSEDARLPTILGVPAGALGDGSPELRPSAHYFVDHRAAWHALGDELPRFGGESGVEPSAASRNSR